MTTLHSVGLERRTRVDEAVAAAARRAVALQTERGLPRDEALGLLEMLGILPTGDEEAARE